MDGSIIIREFRLEDRAFVYNSWLKSYRDSAFANEIAADIYFKWHAELIQRILDKAKIFIAAASEDSDVILGYLVTERKSGKNIVHYVYVKRAFNGLGICRLLFNLIGPIEYASHITKSGKPIIDRMNLKYVPYFMLG